MSDDSNPGGGDAPTVNQRGPELAVALLLAAVAALVIKDSLRVGIGWADDGPRSGYFPFYIGLMLLAASGGIAVKQLLAWGRSRAVFAERSQIALVIAVFVPMVIYVALIAPLGIYVASTGLIAYFMVRHGKYGVLPTALTAVGVPLVFFLVFEKWFLVQLPKGPLEHLLGL
jgi:putative tricarboxylic transport membrane protein